MRTLVNCASAFLAIFGLSCAALPAAQPLQKQPFGKTAGGQPVFLYTLQNSSGMQVKITNYGGIIQSLMVKDRQKNMADVVLGFDTVDAYASKSNTAYFGALIGRYGNRIAHGTFSLDGKTYHLPVNDGPNSLHGGTMGFNRRVWDARDASDSNGPALELHYLSRDGEEGYPGNLNATVRYSLGEKNDLRIDYSATTDKDTVVNLTNHSYFNLSGAGNGTILEDKLTIAADKYNPVDSTLIPTGIQPVAGTPFDFRKATAIGARIHDKSEQLKFGLGYDQNFILNHSSIHLVAVKVEDPKTGRVMEVLTDQPAVQFYTGNHLNGGKGKGGKTYPLNGGLCLETQHSPDSPNHPDFPTTELRPGQTYHSTTIYRFSTE